jgi:hypothetical protein
MQVAVVDVFTAPQAMQVLLEQVEPVVVDVAVMVMPPANCQPCQVKTAKVVEVVEPTNQVAAAHTHLEQAAMVW